MKKFASRVAFGCLYISAAGQTIAQTQPAPSPPPAVWDLEFQDSQCTITTVNKDVPGISVRVIPGQPETELYILDPPRPVSPGKDRKLTLVLEPGGATLRANLGVLSRGDLLDLGVTDYKFPSALSHAQEIRVTGGAGSFSVSIRGADQAMVALQKCANETLSEWGVDPTLLAGLKKPATFIEGQPTITANDYPPDALDHNAQGAVVMRLNVDEKGRVQDCAVVVSSGSKLLDKPTCILALAKEKFDPAIGADGKPTAAPRILRVEWSIMQ